jgi:uncharacterized NAD(P)/FAD-binding protein YdhS
MGDDASKALAAAREQVRLAIERLDEIRADLEATAAGLRLPEQGEDIEEALAGLCEVDAVIRCGLHDHLKPLITSLRSLLPTEEQP